MKRAEKIALIAKIMQGTDSQTTRRLLHQFSDSAPRSLVIIDDLDDNDSTEFKETDKVSFQDKGGQRQMTLSEAHNYARRNRIGTLFILPAKGKP